MRKALYFNYDHYKELGEHAFVNEEFILRLHISKYIPMSTQIPVTNTNHLTTQLEAHCLDTLRQVLMRNVDTGVLGQVWIDPKEPTAFPDFSTKHVCKNYDDIRHWAERIQVSNCSTAGSPVAKLQPGTASRQNT